MTPNQYRLLVVFNQTIPYPIGITTIIRKDDPMTPTQEALLLALARAFRTHMIEQALKDGRDPKEDASLSVLHMALQSFDYEYDLTGPIDLNIQQHMLGDPQYQFKLVGDPDPPEPFINPDDHEETP